MSKKRLRVALFGRSCTEVSDGETIKLQKNKLREEAGKRNYVIIDEFWEENISVNTPLDERPEMQRFIKSVWANELAIDGLFMPDIADLGWTNRKEHVILTMLFELNDIAIITFDDVYNPDEWIAGLSF